MTAEPAFRGFPPEGMAFHIAEAVDVAGAFVVGEIVEG